MFHIENPPQSSGTRRDGITLIEMLVGMAITLVMMGALVTVFANITGSVTKRRASIELSTQLRHVRNVIQRDLQGATCPTVPWQRPESNHGYFELVEGPHTDSEPSLLTNGLNHPTDLQPGPDPAGEIDPIEPSGKINKLSLLPRYGGGPENNPQIGTLVQRDPNNPDPLTNVISTLNGLGDGDDILALTVRNEEEPFVGLVPEPTSVRTERNPDDAESFHLWSSTTIESPLAEVVWFAVENPLDSAGGFFGEPGLRTIYRRVLLIAPWVAPYHFDPNAFSSPSNDPANDIYEDGDPIRTRPGLVRVLRGTVDNASLEGRTKALAALIAFQEKYDLSVRLEWDPSLGSDGRWTILANTLADLTKRENRYEHHHFLFDDDSQDDSRRTFPYAIASLGGGYGSATEPVEFVSDPEHASPANDAEATANTLPLNTVPFDQFQPFVASYTIDAANLSGNRRYNVRPFAYVDEKSDVPAAPDGGLPATARAMLNDQGEVVHVIAGLVPFWGPRRGEDVMLTDALAFDLRVYDPGAPLFGEPNTETVLQPGDPGWPAAYDADIPAGGEFIGDGNLSPSQPEYQYLGQGAYVDLGYGFVTMLRVQREPLILRTPVYDLNKDSIPDTDAIASWFFFPRWIPNRQTFPLAPGYSVYDTWSYSYENNGEDEDKDGLVDEGTNGFDDDAISGVDDVDERETNPPYERPLRGIQVRLRAFERDSQQIREVSVIQHFVPD